MENLEAELRNVRQKEAEILEAIDRRNEKRTIPCACCGIPYAIGELTAIQTHWTTYADGHGGGGDTLEGELQFICPKTGIINRILFNTFDVPWAERKQYAHDPEAQFKSLYKKLFNEVKNVYKESQDEWTNNFYIDKNRAKFGIVEKRDPSKE